MSVRLYRVILPVNDIELASRFYGQVLGMPGRRISDGRHYFNCEGTILACYDPRADGDDHDPTPNPEILYFAVDDLERVYAAIEPAGGEIPQVEEEHGPMGQIARRPWGEVCFYGKDPFGNRICFVERSTMFTGELRG